MFTRRVAALLRARKLTCGINQRAAQEILGHSDANLTAQAYTDVPSLQLHDEIAKLPWISSDGNVAQHSAQNSGVSGPVVSLADILAKLEALTQATGSDGVGHSVALPDTPCQIEKLAARVGIEPAAVFLQAAVQAMSCESTKIGDAQHSAHNFRELSEIVRAWGQMPLQIRQAILAIVRTSHGLCL